MTSRHTAGWPSLSFVLALGVSGLAQAATPWTFEVPLGAPQPYIPSGTSITVEKVDLGRDLFFDPRLSSDGKVSCATCHDPAYSFAQPTKVSTGVDGKTGTRNAPTIINATVYETMFWDGRAASLAEQASKPIENPVEMNVSAADLEEKVKAIPGYGKLFQAVYGAAPTTANISDAIAAYETTILVGGSPMDRYLYGGDKTALSEAAVRGLELYRGKARCQSCHTLGDYDASFTDNLFHNVGVGMAAPKPDLGRFEITKAEADRGAFKTVTLRNIAETAPYMHDGSVATLAEVVELYNKGGEPNPWLSGRIQPLGLTDAEKKDLIAFLESMTGPLPKNAKAPDKLPQ